MNDPKLHSPLTDEEIDRLDHFLLYAGIDDSMPLDMLDGYLHALAVGPTAVPPAQWLPRVWGENFSGMVPPVKNRDEARRITGLIRRLADSIADRLEDPEGPMIVPLWSTFQDGKVEREDATIWACGFLGGIELCEADWAPLLDTEPGRAWLRPISLLGDEDFGPERAGLTATPEQRERLSLEIPEAVLAMQQFWLEHGDDEHEAPTARSENGQPAGKAAQAPRRGAATSRR